MSNSMEYTRTHHTHFSGLPRKMRFQTIAEREEYLAKKRSEEQDTSEVETNEQKPTD